MLQLDIVEAEVGIVAVVGIAVVRKNMVKIGESVRAAGMLK